MICHGCSKTSSNPHQGVLTVKGKGQEAYNVHTVLTDLKSCSTIRDLQWGRKIHSKAVACRHDSNMHVVTSLVRMYAKCGSMTDARRLFDGIQMPDVVSWNVLLLGYAENGNGFTVLELLMRMKENGHAANSLTYVAALKACTSQAAGSRKGDWLELGRGLHSEIGFHMNQYLQNALINMYAKFGSMVEAHFVFDNMQKPDMVSWNALVVGYAENGEGLAALNLFLGMKGRGCAPDSVTYVAALKSCTSLAVKRDGSRQAKCLNWGREIHSEMGFSLSLFLQNTLINMYTKCGSMLDARVVFDRIQIPNVVSWTVLILGYVENGEGLTALELFSRMEPGCAPNSVTYVAALKACTSLAVNADDSQKEKCLEKGRGIHSDICCHLDSYVVSTLINMYGKCGSMVDAQYVFESIQKPNVVCWNALLLGYVENGEGVAALEFFWRMKACGWVPNSLTYVAALKACTLVAVNGDGAGKENCLDQGRQIDSEIGGHSQLDNYVQSALIGMYSSCSSMGDAHRVFNSVQKPDVVCWTALLLGYAEAGDGATALKLFSRMKAYGCVPDSVTYVAALKACTSLAVNGDDNGMINGLRWGRDIHSEIDCHLNHYLQCALIDMYAKCGSIDDARRVFDNIHKINVACWNALLLGYTENGDGIATLELFSRMKASSCAPDSVTYVAALKACGLIGCLALGRKFHLDISHFPVRIVTCLVDFYAKCGSLIEAQEVFDLNSSVRVVPTWNALLAGYGSFGDTVSVFKLFEAMQDQGFQPDEITFVSLLSCCSHAGLVEKAMDYFEAMHKHYKISPTLMHYTCMVDVLGRSNQLKEVINVLQKMPYEPDAVTWMTLLGACCKWRNFEIGKWAFQSLVEMNKKNASAYVLMADIYGSRGM